MLGTIESLERDVQIARKIAFCDEQQAKIYVVSRGVEPTATDRPPWTTYGYRQALLGLDGLDVMEFIQRVIDTKGLARVLDVGCGSGRFLWNCKQGYRRYSDGVVVEGWQDQVECFGLTACIYDNFLKKSRNAGVQIEVGDAQNLSGFYSGQSFDVITAVYVAQHVADPWALVYGMFEKLAAGGGCFIRGMPFNLVAGEDAKLSNYLRKNYAAEVRVPDRADISIKKEPGRKLLLPLEYADVRETRFASRVFYRFNPAACFEPVR